MDDWIICTSLLLVAIVLGYAAGYWHGYAEGHSEGFTDGKDRAETDAFLRRHGMGDR